MGQKQGKQQQQQAGASRTDDVEDGVYCTDVRQEGIAKTGALCCALDQAGNVDDGQVRRHAGRRLVQVAEPLEALVGHGAARLRGVCEWRGGWR